LHGRARVTVVRSLSPFLGEKEELMRRKVAAATGLNDVIVGQGPTDFIVQSPGQDVRTGLTPPGLPGHGGIPEFPIGCRGGSNPENP
jgi:hypothetical protein